MPRALSALSVAALNLLARLSPDRIVALGLPCLPVYAWLRKPARARLQSLRGRVPFAVPSPLAYYRMRLRLAAHSLRHLAGGNSDLPIRIEGEEHYRAAIAAGRPVALLGWHQGPVELLHRLPPPPADAPFFVLTAGAFAPRLAEFLRAGRAQPGKKSVPPGEAISALRAWARRRGVLAVMVDQVPGKPAARKTLWNTVEIPVPEKLLDWMRTQGAILVPVSVRLEPGYGSFAFRYHPPLPTDPIESMETLTSLLESSIREAPLQYNWSYPKIRISTQAGNTENFSRAAVSRSL